MRISDEQVQKVLEHSAAYVEPSDAAVVERIQREDADLIQEVTAEVMAMGDRDEQIERLRQAIARGEYNPSATEIADAMMRRAIADRIR